MYPRYPAVSAAGRFILVIKYIVADIIFLFLFDMLKIFGRMKHNYLAFLFFIVFVV